MTIRDKLDNFLVPEKEISLKIIFDNVRNYLICGALLSLVFWFESGKAIAPPILFRGPPKGGWHFLLWSSIAAFTVLFALNAFQSYVIGRRILSFLEKRPSSTKSPEKKRPLLAHGIIFLVALALTFIFLIVIFSFGVLAIYLSWFAAIGAGRP